jgi:hypothetical protein
MVIEACRAVLTERCRLMCKQRGRQQEVGRRFGPVLLRHVPKRTRRATEECRKFLERRGGPAVFLGRFTALFRAVIPSAAGLSAMRYRTFLFWNALGGLCWATVFTLTGYLAGRSYERVISAAGTASALIIVLVAITIAGLVIWRKVRENREKRAPRRTAPEVSSGPVDSSSREQVSVAAATGHDVKVSPDKHSL